MNENVLNVGNLRRIVSRKPMGMAPDRFHWKIKEHYGPIVADSETCGLFLKYLKRFIIRAERGDDLSTGIGSAIYAAEKEKW